MHFPSCALGGERFGAARSGFPLAFVAGDAGLRDRQRRAPILRRFLHLRQACGRIVLRVEARELILDMVEACLGFATVGLRLLARFSDGRELGFGLARLALDGSQRVACCDMVRLRVAPERAQALFLGGGGGVGGGCLLIECGQALNLGALNLLPLEHLREAIALGEALSGGRHAAGDDDESVPPPQVALAADEALALLQVRLQSGAELARHDADLAQAARQFGRCADVQAQWLRVGWEGSVLGAHFDGAPAYGRVLVRRRVEVVAQGCNEGCFVPRRNAQLFYDGRHSVLVGRHHELRQRLALGNERGERHACVLHLLGFEARGLREVAELVLGFERCRLDGRDLAGERLAFLGDCGELEGIGRGGGCSFGIALERRELVVDALQGCTALGFRSFERLAPRAGFGGALGDDGELFVGGFERGGCFFLCRVNVVLGGFRFLLGGFKRLHLDVEARQNFLGFGDLARFAREIPLELACELYQLLAALGAALGLFCEAVSLDADTR